MYQTRFVYQLPLERAGEVAAHVTNAMQETSMPPANVRVQPADDLVFATITYMTPTLTESDQLIQSWKSIDVAVQVERTHRLDPDQFDAVLLAEKNGRALRLALSRAIRELCVRGVGSKGILEYLDECEEIVMEAQVFVESQRAHL